ncbi:VOC family protein [Flagellimonas nanhaiensis]|uniref:Bleomycin resistance protein n=1 Tax=Flagellimonas nanhaiensis TaxID=2292706 RepID=A0A371JTM2_9FLAO|nr:VOC family protein [Allomuricauda nanhaiensis]RDY61126.1 bleomycin resistance protein [Allomuricauda nanhaiensis]
MNAQFHLALPCKNLEETKVFYRDTIMAGLGRNTEKWLDVDLFGNQLTFTQAGDFTFDFKNYKLDNYILPSFHFGVIVPVDIWGELYTRLFQMDLEVTTEATFMQGKKGEHLSFFVQDPNGYMLEFKSFKDSEEVFSE